MLSDILSKVDLKTLLDIVNMCYQPNDDSQLMSCYCLMMQSLKNLIPYDFAIATKAYKRLLTTYKKRTSWYVHTDVENNLKTFEVFNFSYPKEYLKIYKNKKFYRIDPVVKESLSKFGYNKWSDIFKKYPPPEELISTATDFGLIEGCAFGDSTLGNQGGCLLLISGSEVDYDDRTVILIKHFVPHLHNFLGNINRRTLFAITKRENEVIKWLCNGKTSWEISRILNVSERTINFHANNLYTKLNVVNRPQLIAFAVKYNLISIGDIFL